MCGNTILTQASVSLLTRSVSILHKPSVSLLTRSASILQKPHVSHTQKTNTTDKAFVRTVRKTLTRSL